MRNAYLPRQNFVGTGSLATYSFTFKITDPVQLLVIVTNLLGVQVLSARGTDPSLNLQFDEEAGGGTITFAAPLTTGYKLMLLQADDIPLQPFKFRNKGQFTQERIEAALDWLSGQIQRLTYRMGRAFQLNDADPYSFDPTFPVMDPTKVAGRIPVFNDAGNGWAPVADWFNLTAFNESGGAGGLLSAPTDGKFGGPGGGIDGTAGSVSGIDIGDKLMDALDKQELIFEKLAPAKPPNVSATTLTITSSYAAKESGTGTLRASVIDSANPTILHVAGAYDADAGTLSAELDTVEVGTRLLSTGNDAGTYGALQIVDDYDFWAGVAGKEGFWKAFHARINATALALGVHVAVLKHTLTGNATLNFSVDDPGATTASFGAIVGSGTTIYISGVPSLPVSGLITVPVTIANAVRAHYNATKVGTVTTTNAITNPVDLASPGTVPSNGDALVSSTPLVVVANRYTEQVQVNANGTNSKGVNGTTASTTTNIRVDTQSTESRVSSGSGQYPASGYNAAWVSTDLLSANKELQMLAGLYQYPPLVSYAGNLPVAGPNYTGLTPDAYANMRWVTFNLGAKSAVTSLVFNILGGVNLGGTTLITGFEMYVRIDGATPTSGWVNANAAYPGVGNPTANGDAALDVGSSTTSSRRVTFGAAPKTGNVIVRIGIPSGSTKKFSSVTVV